MRLTIVSTKNELCHPFPDMTKEEIDTKVWIADSGASTHMTKTKKEFGRTRPYKTNVEVGEGSLT